MAAATLFLVFSVATLLTLRFSSSDTSSEAMNLLKWRDSLDNINYSSILSSWNASKRNSPCSWNGISCDESGHISRINLTSSAITGTLAELSFSSLPNLLSLDLSKNSLFGPLPSALGNLSKITWLDLSFNEFSGTIPPEISKLNTLEFLCFMVNNLSGNIPAEVNNLTHLSVFHLSDNMLTGELPEHVCSGGLLENFSVYSNNFTGPIPRSLKNCTSLIRVRLDRNILVGNISEGLGVYPNLVYMDLSYNRLYGELSSQWGMFHNLTSLKISDNNISGKIPPELGNVTELSVIDLSSNSLVGEIPKEICNLSSLYDLKLNHNKLTGTFPKEIEMMSSLAVLDLAANNLSGMLPEELAKCSKLWYLNMSSNEFSGGIPYQIHNLQSLQNLDLSLNMFTGEIPDQLGQMMSLEVLNLSRNSLSGSIPASFDLLKSLTSVDVSYNQLVGPLPDNNAFLNASIEAFSHNKGLCSAIISGLEKCPSTETEGSSRHKKGSKFIILVICPLLISLLLLCIIAAIYFFVHRKRKMQQKKVSTPKHEDMFSILNYDGRIVYENIIEATEGLHSKFCVGKGGQGSVYRAELVTGQVVAVKKIEIEESDRSMGNMKAFKREIQAMTNIRHRNIVKFYGSCVHSSCALLVYEYLTGGSLADALRVEKVAKAFDWSKRINVLKDLANGLDYLHHDCSPSIVHRDISSKNILLNLDYEAHICDFGTAKLLKSNNSTSWTSFAGTYGYCAPELAYTMEINEKCDVYSFGVVVMEVLMGKDPGELVALLLSPSSAQSSTDHQDIHLIDMLDQRISSPSDKLAAEVIMMMKTAVQCLRYNQRSRPTMRQVSQKLLSSRSPTAPLTASLDAIITNDKFADRQLSKSNVQEVIVI